MTKIRVIPVLLLISKGLVKTVRFKKPKYIGDPINSVRIFNEKEVDELFFLDIRASLEGRPPDFDLLADISGEAFMPMAYGGGIASLDHIRKIFSLGFEKVVISTGAYKSKNLIREAVEIFGSQSIVGCIDVRRDIFGRPRLYSHSGTMCQSAGILDHVASLERIGVGEILVNSINQDGTQAGYDINLLQQVSSTVSIPVVACGGASGIHDFVAAVEQGGASAVAAGSFFVFVGPHRAVLITYPSRRELESCLP